MVRASLLPSLLLIAVAVNAQQKERPEIVRKGLLRAQATITPAVLINDGALNIYIHGDMDFFLSRNVSVRGDCYYFIDTQGDGDLRHNHGIFFGANYHFPKGRFDPYIGIQPGASYVQAEKNMPWGDEGAEIAVSSTGTVVPNISLTTGLNFYVSRFVHFMTNVRYVHGKHATPWGNRPLDEFRFSFGLGWNVNTMKQK
ncbi:MAG: hypothetical protein K9J06_04805 [Flavobacteriales bacterium]|nr:hypothetical protein [Flavobacteriales bacterium]